MTYHVFSELDGEATSNPDPGKLAGLKPGETSRTTVIGALGTPNFWSTAVALGKGQPEQLGYYWTAERRPSFLLRRFLVTFDEMVK